MSHEVFISYSHKDKPIADGICANLETAGLRCWIAPRDIGPGEDWPTAIANGIAACRVMVLVFSESANLSDEVSRELYLAANSKLIIIPFIIENVKPEAGKAYYMGRTHWLDAMNPPTQEQIGQLIQRINSLIKPISTAGEIGAAGGQAMQRTPGASLHRRPRWAFPVSALVVAAALLVAGYFALPRLRGAALPAAGEDPAPASSFQLNSQSTPFPAAQSQASPTQAGVSSMYLYREDFNNPQYDGTLPPNVSADPNQCTNLRLVQENGSLTFEIPANIDLRCGLHLNVGSDMALRDVRAIEFAVGESPEMSLSHSSIAFMLEGVANDQKSLFLVCGLNSTRAGCTAKIDQQDVYQTKDIVAKPGDKLTFRIEVLDPDTMAFRFIANGETIGEYGLPPGDVAVYRDLSYRVGGGPTSMGPTTKAGAYLLDYLAIEKR